MSMPELSETLCQALSYYQSGNWQQANLLCCQNLINEQERSKTLNLLGLIAHQLGQTELGISYIRQSLSLDPKYAKAYCSLGQILQIEKKLSEAIVNFNLALKLDPDFPEAHLLIGQALEKQGRIQDAIIHYEQAICLKADYADALFCLGNLLSDLNQFQKAINYYQEALIKKPDWLICRQKFIFCLKQIKSISITEELVEELNHCFTSLGVDYQDLTGVTIAYIKQRFNLNLINGFLKNEEFYQKELLDFFEDNLLQYLLSQTVNTDPFLEKILTQIRRYFITHSNLNAVHYDKIIQFMFCLSSQCFNNEYIWAVDELEKNNVIQLKEEIEILLNNEDIVNYRILDGIQVKLLLFSLYSPLYTLNNFQKLLYINKNGEYPWLQKLIKRQIEDYLEEKKLKQSISSFTKITNSTSLKVKYQYEENPYPRWISIPQTSPREAYDEFSNLFPFFQPPAFLKQPLKILVAGCGTGREAINWANYLKNVEVFAIDLSSNSLAYAMRMAKDLSITNIRFYQGDILQLLESDFQFSIIICSGVLHHLENPTQGLMCLVKLLQPLGLMKIGLYSYKARQAIRVAQKLVNSKRFSNTESRVREGRQFIINLPDDSIASSIKTEIRDFYSFSECRDLLFHIQEKQFNLSQINQLLHDFELEFLGFTGINLLVKETYKKLFSSDLNMTNLFFWDAFEDLYPNTFLEMYNFWCQKVKCDQQVD